MTYSYSDWNNKQGTIPVQWKTNNYEQLPWYRNPDRDKGFATAEKNYNIYGERVGCYIPQFEEAGKGIFIPDDVDKIFGYVVNKIEEKRVLLRKNNQTRILKRK